MSTHQLAQIEKKLKKRHTWANSRLSSANPSALNLVQSGALHVQNLRQKSGRMLAGFGLAGSLLLNTLAPGAGTTIASSTAPKHVEGIVKMSFTDVLKNSLADLVPKEPTKLSPSQAIAIENAVKEVTGIDAKATLENQSLNHQVGYIGYEQHLARFPGDKLENHDEELIAGMAPGRGAWGYFAPSKEQFTKTDYLREKYYSNAQVHMLPDFMDNVAFYRDWYKYRKIIVINPANGKAVVTAMGDVGPAGFTGKQFGASPDTMKELNLHKGPRKGLVVYLFVDDPSDSIPLGPLNQPINVNT